MTDSQEIAKYFVEQTGLKFTGKMYSVQIGTANSLLKIYNKEDIKYAIDYLVKNPPRKGFTSLAFIQYVINEILLKKKACAELKKSEFVNIVDTAALNLQDDNSSKYASKGKAVFHNIKKIF